MHRKYAVATIVAAGFAIQGYALHITPQQAYERSVKNAAIRALVPEKRVSEIKPVATFSNAYVFNTTNEGFFVTSADDAMPAVLGYSNHGRYVEGQMPPVLDWWLSLYTAQPQSCGVSYAGLARVEPLMKTQWDQGAPYNNLCPEDAKGRCFTGCVATAMAQVMKYWQYPAQGTGSITYKPASFSRQLTHDFSADSYDWANMLNSYTSYSEVQGSAVAALMKACGHAVRMNYSSVSSGALSIDIPEAMSSYLGYDAGARYVQRMTMSDTEWTRLIHDNLVNVGPVIYNGQTDFGGGHSFVCDGYDGNGYFHFNWGWGGMADGYFMLPALNPSQQGIGGASGGYNSQQDAVIGIRPATGANVLPAEARLTQYGALTATTDGSRTITFGLCNYWRLGWGNSTTRRIEVKMGAMIEPVDGTPGDVQYVSTYTTPEVALLPGAYFKSGENLVPIVRLPLTLPDGKYKVTLTARDLEQTNAPWLPVIPPYGYPNYVTVIKENGVHSVTNAAVGALEVTQAALLTPLVYEHPVKVQATFSNNNAYEVTQAISPVFLDNEFRRFFGESTTVTLQPGETRTHTWTSNLNIMGWLLDERDPEQFQFAFYDPVSTTYYGKYDMKKLHVVNDPMEVTLNALTIENREMILSDGPQPWLPHVDVLNISGTLTAKSGYFTRPISVSLLVDGNVVKQATADSVPFLMAGEQGRFNCRILKADAGDYTLQVTTADRNGQHILASITVGICAGVNDITAEGHEVKWHASGEELTVSAEKPMRSVQLFSPDGRMMAESVNCHTQTSLHLATSTAAGVLRVVFADGTVTVKMIKL